MAASGGRRRRVVERLRRTLLDALNLAGAQVDRGRDGGSLTLSDRSLRGLRSECPAATDDRSRRQDKTDAARKLLSRQPHVDSGIGAAARCLTSPRRVTVLLRVQLAGELPPSTSAAGPPSRRRHGAPERRPAAPGERPRREPDRGLERMCSSAGSDRCRVGRRRRRDARCRPARRARRRRTPRIGHTEAASIDERDVPAARRPARSIPAPRRRRRRVERTLPRDRGGPTPASTWAHADPGSLAGSLCGGARGDRAPARA